MSGLTRPCQVERRLLIFAQDKTHWFISEYLFQCVFARDVARPCEVLEFRIAQHLHLVGVNQIQVSDERFRRLRIAVTAAARQCVETVAGDRTDMEVESFEELAFSVTLNAQRFLIIGPSAATTATHLAGTHLMTRLEDGQIFENVYCIAPKIIRRDIEQ